MGSASIHKSEPMKREIERGGYRTMYLPAYSPELNPIDQSWSAVKSKLKRTQLLDKETLSSRITDASNDLSLNDLYGFISHSKLLIDNCYNKVKF
jgi:transposase